MPALRFLFVCSILSISLNIYAAQRSSPEAKYVYFGDSESEKETASWMPYLLGALLTSAVGGLYFQNQKLVARISSLESTPGSSQPPSPSKLPGNIRSMVNEWGDWKDKVEELINWQKGASGQIRSIQGKADSNMRRVSSHSSLSTSSFSGFATEAQFKQLAELIRIISHTLSNLKIGHFHTDLVALGNNLVQE